jgi:hypothetical protein
LKADSKITIVFRVMPRTSTPPKKLEGEKERGGEGEKEFL